MQYVEKLRGWIPFGAFSYCRNKTSENSCKNSGYIFDKLEKEEKSLKFRQYDELNVNIITIVAIFDILRYNIYQDDI